MILSPHSPPLEPTKCLVMKLKEEHESEQEYRCCPPALDLCAGMVKVTPGGKEREGELKGKSKAKKHAKKKEEESEDEDDDDDDDDDDDSSEEDEDDDDEEDKPKVSKKEKKTPVPANKVDEKREEEERRRDQVRKRILTTGKLSSGT